MSEVRIGCRDRGQSWAQEGVGQRDERRVGCSWSQTAWATGRVREEGKPGKSRLKGCGWNSLDEMEGQKIMSQFQEYLG